MTVYYEDASITLHHGDALNVLRTLPDQSVNCCVTSPPYLGLRDYGIAGQIGLGQTPTEYITSLRDVFREVRRVLADDGTCWMDLGDAYSPDKNLRFMPHRVAMALQDDGWVARNAVVWNRTNAMPESVTDRLSTRYEMVFMFSKKRTYWFNLDPIREANTSKPQRRFGPPARASNVGGHSFSTSLSDVPHVIGHPLGRNPGDVWSIHTTPFTDAHFAVFPPELPRRCIVAGCCPGGVVLDPFHGSGTTGKVAVETGRKYVGIELNRDYLDLSLQTRLTNGTLDFGDVS
jgi:site-specific DNA-methyltransferase (cytosine-N4-specific)